MEKDCGKNKKRYLARHYFAGKFNYFSFFLQQIKETSSASLRRRNIKMEKSQRRKLSYASLSHFAFVENHLNPLSINNQIVFQIIEVTSEQPPPPVRYNANS